MGRRWHKEALLNYLRAVFSIQSNMGGPIPAGYNCHSFEEYVLKHGREYKPQNITRDERAYLLRIASRHREGFPIKQCFYNSQMLLMHDYENRLEYVEGYCADLILPVHHGWLSMSGKVVDVTLRLRDQSSHPILGANVLGDFPEGRTYYGVPFPKEEVTKYMRETGLGGSLLDDPKRAYPFMKIGAPWLQKEQP